MVRQLVLPEFETGRIYRFDLDTGKPAGRPLQAGRNIRDIAVDEDGVRWAPSEKDRTLARFDIRSGRRIGDPIEIGPNTARGGGRRRDLGLGRPVI